MIYADLIGKPFLWGARGPDAFDCWGLVRECIARQGVTPPEYPSSTEGTKNAGTILAAMDKWQSLDKPEVGCAILFRMDARLPTHVGIVVAPDRFLHITEKTCAVIERLSSPLWKHRIVGYFRWQP